MTCLGLEYSDPRKVWVEASLVLDKQTVTSETVNSAFLFRLRDWKGSWTRGVRMRVRQHRITAIQEALQSWTPRFLSLQALLILK